MLNLELSNRLINDSIRSGNPFSVARIGIGELDLCYRALNNYPITQRDIIVSNYQGGVYGDCFREFLEIYLNSVMTADIHCYWAGCGLESKQDNVFSKTSPSSPKMHHRVVEPYYLDSPWSQSLQGKKVLVVNSFPETIEHQYPKRDQIWGDKQVLPEFNLITYKSVQSIGDLNPHGSWVESLNVMKNDISNIDFDIALLGCSTYGLPLVDFIKRHLNKSAIYVGGAIQILFGIKGKRWETHDEISLFFNEHWVRPFDNERVRNYKILEGGCYW